MRIVRSKGIVFDMDGAPTLIVMNSRDRPPAYNSAHCTVVIKKVLTGTNGELIGIAERKNMRDIRAGNRALRLRVVVVLIEGACIDRIFSSRCSTIIGIDISNRL